MNVKNTNDWKQKAVTSSRSLNLVSDERKNLFLLSLADEIDKNCAQILKANAYDLAGTEPENPLYDRLKLTPERIFAIAEDVRNVASLPSPTGRILMQSTRPNGMKITKISVPFGVIGVIYEARPNVSFDVFSLCFKSGNACVLKGGSDAYHSNFAIVDLIKKTLINSELDENIVTLLSAGREAASELMNATGYVDVIIPRGGKGLIDFVRQNSLVPVIETGAGVCHTYFDEYGDLEKGINIVFNAKTRRVSVCNALDCLIIDEKRLADLPQICRKMAEKNVIIYADEHAYEVLAGNYAENLLKTADAESFGTEFLDYKMAVKTVKNIGEAIEHITKFSSGHSECIISEDASNIQIFISQVDAACVYTNVSTAFTDGAQFGLGAEIGISTQKLHARGPMGLEELCSYKWLIEGDGQVR